MQNLFFQLLVNTLVAGSIYALIAGGFSLIYYTNKFMHFAHGAVIMLSAHIFFLFFSKFGNSLIFSTIITIIFSAFLGYALDELFYAPLRRKNASGSIKLISSIAVLIILEAIALLFFGANMKVIHFPWENSSIELLGVSITYLQIAIFLAASFFGFLLHIFIHKTKIGYAIKAVAENRILAELSGISAKETFRKASMIGSSFAGLVAILISLEQGIETAMGTNLVIKGFTGSIIGGIENVTGSFFGAYLLGLAENFSIWFFPSEYKNSLVFVILFIFLIFKPSGILGVKNN